MFLPRIEVRSLAKSRYKFAFSTVVGSACEGLFLGLRSYSNELFGVTFGALYHQVTVCKWQP